jgi:putative spermidine/putrescine transport system permease protein
MMTSDGQRLGPGMALVFLVAFAVLLFLIVPVLIVVIASFGDRGYLSFPPTSFSLRWYERFLTDSQWLSAIWVSVRVAAIASVVSTVVAIPASMSLVRGRFRFKGSLYAFVLAPLIVPIIITAIGLYFFFSRLGGTGSVVAMGLGHAVLALPVVVIIITASLQGVDENLERAALGLGASRFYAVRKITLPLIAPSIFAAALFSFLISFDELLVPLFLSGIRAQTLSVKIWESIQYELSPTIAAVSAFLIAITIVILTSTALFRRKADRRRT